MVINMDSVCSLHIIQYIFLYHVNQCRVQIKLLLSSTLLEEIVDRFHNVNLWNVLHIQKVTRKPRLNFNIKQTFDLK